MSSPSLPRFADEALDLKAFFAPADLSDWEQAASEALRGAPLEQLSSRSLDGLHYQPIYSAADLPAGLSQHPAGGDLRRGHGQSGWRLSLAYCTADSLLQDAADGLLEGVDGLQFEGPPSQLSEQLKQPGLPPLQCLSDLSQLQTAPAASQHVTRLWDGWSACLQASKPEPQAWQAQHQQLAARLQSATTERLLISSRPWHEAGASASLELATLAASLVESLQAMASDSLTAQQILNQSTLELSVGPELFLELAKCRAARLVIQRVAEAYGADLSGLHWQTRTDRRFLSQLDRYNNLLRQTLSALAAVLGGVQTLITEPLDILNPAESQSSDARRLARNLQLILKHEVHLDQWVDPVGGSYMIEKLTQALAESAWQAFQAIEAEGGLLQVWASGRLQQEVAEMAATRQQRAATRQQTLVGVNLYAAAETLPPAQTAQALQPLPALRLAAPFEALRQAQAAAPVRVQLLTLGSLERARPRLEFASAFFAVAGCTASSTAAAENHAELQALISASEADILVLCGADNDYESLLSAGPLNCPPERQLVLAGKAKDAYREAGVRHFIFAGCDLLASFKALQPGWFA